MATSIAKLAIQFVADADGLTAGVKSATTALGGFVKHAKLASVALVGMGIGAATVAVHRFAASVKESLDSIDALAKDSKKLGIGIGELQGLSYAAELSGVSSDQLRTAVVKLLDSLGEARSGSKTASAAFKRLGLDMADLKGKTPRETFVAVADSLSRVEDPALRTKMAIDLMGRSAAELMPLLAEGAAGLDKLFKERGSMPGLTDADAKAVEAANDAWTRMTTSIKSAADVAATELAPAIQSAAETVSEMFVDFQKWRNSLPDRAKGTFEAREQALKDDLREAGFRGDGSDNALKIFVRPDLAGRALAINEERKANKRLAEQFGKPIDPKELMSAEERARIKAFTEKSLAEDIERDRLRPPERGIGTLLPHELESANEALGNLFSNIAGTISEGKMMLDDSSKKAAEALRPLLGEDGAFVEDLGDVLDAGARGLIKSGVESLHGFAKGIEADMDMLQPSAVGATGLQRGTAAAFATAQTNAENQRRAEELRLQEKQAKSLESIERTGVRIRDDSLKIVTMN